MRLDYGLYGVAIICFIIVGAFAASAVPRYTPAKIEGIAVIIIFLVLGVISGTVGYYARPKAVMPTTQPTPPPTAPEASTPEPLPPAPPVTEPLPPAPPTPPQPEETPVAPPTEPEPAKVAEEEKPKAKPVRRRRKKAQ